eukprot:jgi/Bigna1/65485/fgenesh1_kg.111_\
MSSLDASLLRLKGLLEKPWAPLETAALVDEELMDKLIDEPALLLETEKYAARFLTCLINLEKEHLRALRSRIERLVPILHEMHGSGSWVEFLGNLIMEQYGVESSTMKIEKMARWSLFGNKPVTLFYTPSTLPHEAFCLHPSLLPGSMQDELHARVESKHFKVKIDPKSLSDSIITEKEEKG